MDSGPINFVAYILSFLYSKPINLYFFDLYKGNNLLSGKFRLLANYIKNRIIKKASLVFFMWEDLYKCYKERYPKYSNRMIIIPLSIRINAQELKINRKNIQKQISDYKIVYTGLITNVQIDVILCMVEAIKILGNVELYLFTLQDKLYIKKLKLKYPILNYKKVIFDSADGERLAFIQKNADILYFPFSFNNQYRSVVANMIGGKLLEYMASGSPILIHAPKYSAVVKYAQKERFAVIVDDLSAKNLSITIQRVLNNKNNICETIIRNAFNVAKKFHNASKNSYLLRKYLEI